MTVDDFVRMLAPGVSEVAAMLKRAQENPALKIPEAEARKKLAKDFKKIEAEKKQFDAANYPSSLNPGDFEIYEQALQRARLAVYYAEVVIQTAIASDAGHDVTVSASLGQALQSAMTGSGDRHGELKPPRITANSLTPTELDFRARLVALVELVDDDRAAIQKLYDAAEMGGLGRKKAISIVANARKGKLRDPTFLGLWHYWKNKLQPLVAAGEDASTLLDQH